MAAKNTTVANINTMRVSQFFIISPRGDTILSKDFRGDIPFLSHTAPNVFWEWLQNQQDKYSLTNTGNSNIYEQSLCKIVHINHLTFVYYKNEYNIYYLFVSNVNLQPSYIVEMLDKLIQSFRDYCGRRKLNEQTIRDNFILLYELLDEFMDFGYLQISNVSDLMALNVIYNQPTLDHLSEIWNLLLAADLVIGSNAVATGLDMPRIIGASSVLGSNGSAGDGSSDARGNLIGSHAPPAHPTTTVIDSPEFSICFCFLVLFAFVFVMNVWYFVLYCLSLFYNICCCWLFLCVCVLNGFW